MARVGHPPTRGSKVRALLLLALLVGCTPLAGPVAGRPSPEPARLSPVPTAPPAVSQTVVMANTPSPRPSATATPASTREQVRVLRVWDGNTVLIEGGFSVRYIGVETPGAGALGRPLEPFGRDAAELNVRLVEGRMVELEKDVSEVDQRGFLLRYVYVGGILVNAELLRAGLARYLPRAPDLKYQELLSAVEREARQARRGIWGAPPPVTAVPPATPPRGLLEGPTAEPTRRTTPGPIGSPTATITPGPTSGRSPISTPSPQPTLPPTR